MSKFNIYTSSVHELIQYINDLEDNKEEVWVVFVTTEFPDGGKFDQEVAAFYEKGAAEKFMLDNPIDCSVSTYKDYYGPLKGGYLLVEEYSK